MRHLISLGFFICCFVVSISAYSDEQSFSGQQSHKAALQNEIEAAPHLQVKAGERCIVCGTLLEPNDYALELRGRRVPIARGMIDQFKADPEKYFSKLQPRGALFQETLDQPYARWGWFLFGITVTLFVVLVALAATRVINRELDPSTPEPSVCPKCGAFIHPAALACNSCGQKITPRYEAETKRAM